MKKTSKETSLGDFLTWATKNEWWLRGFESIQRTFWFNEKKEEIHGWSFIHCTSICKVSDEDINKEVPPKTADEWDRWGR